MDGTSAETIDSGGNLRMGRVDQFLACSRGRVVKATD